MTREANGSGAAGKGGRKANDKARLARELRDNLKRRKGQARERGADDGAGSASRAARKTLIDPDNKR